MLKDKNIKCDNCNSIFDADENRFFIFSKLSLEEKHWPSPGFSNILKEWMNYNIVKCPTCGNKFKASELRLLFLFSPLGLLGFVIVLNILILLYFYSAFMKK